ncbi:hypothetical protein FDO65_15520 [Nakamurella flava]|uniref:Glycosyltransferase family 39 protein n=1 Tax=Nakamurella flava TaxID=2576308 RepID=A0A4U6QF58_9ACTN|nr:hypothetical protein [Nakamurella flava]TKV58897.1 hypothetical protein FDO65_15520 [Nakamurella flava]
MTARPYSAAPGDPSTAEGTTSTVPAEPAPARRGGASRIGGAVVFALTLVVLAVVTIFRYTAPYLQADGVQQSIMSIQNVDLFYWGQNRFAAVVSFLASPFSDPAVNLFVCLLINSLCFYGMLLVIAVMGVRALTGEFRWPAVYVLWVLTAATANVIIVPSKLHIISLESQPYSMSWLLTLGAFLLWKRSVWWAWALAAACAGVAMGLNPSVLTVAAFLAIIEMFRRRQWLRWPAFGVMWVAWFAVWQFLSSRLGGNAGPIPDAPQDYFSFSRGQFVAEFPQAVGSVTGALSPSRLMVLGAVAALAALLLPAERRAALLPRFALVVLFSLGYFTVFAGNPWVSLNGYPVRYFFPVLIAVVLFLAAPIAGALLTARVPVAAAVRQPVVAVGAVVAAAASLVGPLTPPSDSVVLQDIRAAGDFARSNDISFLSGYYWDMWPLLWETLEDGRESHFVTGFKSGGDPDAYKERFQADLASGTPPRAMCVNETDSFCTTYLDYWTEPGWQFTGQTCPVPGPTPQLGSPQQKTCRVLEYTGGR